MKISVVFTVEEGDADADTVAALFEEYLADTHMNYADDELDPFIISNVKVKSVLYEVV